MGLNDGKLQAWALPVGPSSQWSLFPALQTGVHLRWALQRDLGFPWGGYYLLARNRGGSHVTQGPPAPWTALAGFGQPIALPVNAEGYAAGTVIKPLLGKADLDVCATYGFARVTGPLKSSLQASFVDLFEVLKRLVSGGLEAGDMASRTWLPPADKPAKPNDPQLVEQSLLDLVLLGAAYPEYAQLIGLYAVDAVAMNPVQPEGAPPQAKDYLVIADCRATFGCEILKAVAWANSGYGHLLGVHARMVENVPLVPCGKLPPPKTVAAYLVPTSSSPVEDQPNAVTPWLGGAALVWDCDPLSEVTGDSPLWPNLFHVRRATLPAPTKAPLDIGSEIIDIAKAEFLPVIPGDIQWHLAPAVRQPPARGTTVPREWPPWAPQFFDGTLGEGWHLWRIQAMDWFGRRSLASDPAQWRHWSPMKLKQVPLGGFSKFFAGLPNVDGGGDTRIHTRAMLLLDKTPPPAPSGLEVDVLDSKDDLHCDKAWIAKNAALVGTSKFGARIRWSWPYAAQRQAPDCKEFRVYVRPGATGVWRGVVKKAWTTTNNLKGSHCFEIAFVDKGLPSDAALSRATLRFGQTAAKIEFAETGPGSTTILVNLPPPHVAESIAVGSPCTVVSPGKQDGSAVNVTVAPWSRVATVDKTAGKNVFEVFRADDGQPYELPLTQVLPDGIRVGFDTPLNAVFSGLWQLAVLGTLGNGNLDWSTAKLFAIVGVDLDKRVIFTDPQPGKLDAAVGWTRAYLGQATTTYECYLDLEGLVPEPPAGQPKGWFEVAVSAADDKAHTPDWCADPTSGNRPGNESEATGPRRGERLRWAAPEKVEGNWGEGPLYATPADVDGRSFFTLRWKATDVPVRLLRAAAIDVFRADWDAGGKGLVGTPLEDLLKKFPGLMAPDLAVADGRKSFAPIAAAYAVLDAVVQQNIASGDNAAGAFLPVTGGAISKAMAPDLVGPDSPLDYKPQVNLCAFVDSLDGLVPARWFYRVVATDDAPLPTSSTPVAVPDLRPPESPVVISCSAMPSAVPTANKSGASAGDATGSPQTQVQLKWQVPPGAVSWSVEREGPGLESLTVQVKPKVVNGVALWVDLVKLEGAAKYRMIAANEAGATSKPSAWQLVEIRQFAGSAFTEKL